jgi:hypothetical protein
MKKADSSKTPQTQRKELGLLDQPATALNFWFCAGLLAILAASMMSRDITRPFYGLHSWGQAHDAWVARSNVKYGLGYTKGFDTFAVGNPPAENPTRYLDHPVLFTLLNSFAMLIFGVNTWALRVTNILATIAALLLLLKILRGLADDTTALLAGLFFCLFPLTAYFGVNQWLYPLSFLAIWCYLVLIGALKDAPQPKKFHKWALAISLFLALQMTWEGFFFALAIGVHYVFHCIRRRQFPEKKLLAILIIAPLSSLILDFVILAGGHNWDFQRIIELAKWRTGKGEMENVMIQFDWSRWFARVWEFAVTNFSLPVLITAIGYLTLGQLFVFASAASDKQKAAPSRRFPQFWLFFMPPVFQLFILKGTLWPHQYWERPLAPFIAIAAALGVMVLADILKNIHQRLAVGGAVVLVGISSVFCMIGTNHYYSIRWQQPEKIEMFQMLNAKIPPDKALLSFEPHVIDQKPGVKQASYRPEVAWYLDRDIVVARTIEEIDQKAKTGKYPYYLIPRAEALMPLINQLAQRYKYDYIPGREDKKTKKGEFLEAGMYPYMIFDLSSRPTQ